MNAGGLKELGGAAGAGSAAAGGTCPKQPNWEPCIAKDLANERFRNCCQRLGEGCAQLCSYDSNLTTVSLGECGWGRWKTSHLLSII